GRSSPAITMSSVDLPEPEGPTMPIASPWPILRSMSLRICTRAAPRPSDRLTPVSAIAGASARFQVSFMRWIRRLRAMIGPGRVRPRSYGGWAAPVQAFVQALVLAAAFGGFAANAAAETPVKIVALGDSLTAGFGLPANAAFPSRLEESLKAKGHAV